MGHREVGVCHPPGRKQLRLPHQRQLLEALAGVSSPAADKKRLLLGDLETAANFICRLECLAASPFVSVAEPAKAIGGVESIARATKDGINRTEEWTRAFNRNTTSDTKVLAM
jgi:hypothetical protein